MIKELTLGDVVAVKALFLKVFSNPPWNDKWESDEQLSQYMMDLMDNKNSLTMGYYEGENLIGISMGIVYHWWQGTDYYIKEFCIDDECQGQGHGKRFLAALDEELHKRKIEAIWLMTERSVPAFQFYLNNNFHELTDNVTLARKVKK